MGARSVPGIRRSQISHGFCSQTVYNLWRETTLCNHLLRTVNACRVRLLSRHSAEVWTYVIARNPNNHSLRKLSRVGIFSCKTGISTAEPESSIIMLTNPDLPQSLGSGPNISIITALPFPFCAQTNQANALCLMRQVSKL